MPRSRWYCPVLAKTVPAGARKRASDVDGLIQPGDTLRMERAGVLLAVEKRIGEGGQGVVRTARSTSPVSMASRRPAKSPSRLAPTARIWSTSTRVRVPSM
jgi:hypothetical protein